MTIEIPRGWSEELYAREVYRQEIMREGYQAWLAATQLPEEQLPMAWFQKAIWEWYEQANLPSLGPKKIRCYAMIHREGAKSTTAERIWGYGACRRWTKYALYLSRTKELATGHVENIRKMVERSRMRALYPELSEVAKTRTGFMENWSKAKLSTQAGATIEAVGCDSSIRGKKDGDDRPDLIIVDDVDKHTDSERTTTVLYENLRRALFPSGKLDGTKLLIIQNRVKKNGVIDRLWQDAPRNAVKIGPVPAIKNLELEGQQIIGGRSSWRSIPMDKWQDMLETIGIDAFMEEYQHDVGRTKTHVFYRDWFRYLPLPETFDFVCIGVDPAGKAKEASDETGIVIVGFKDGIAYVLEDLTGKYGATAWVRIVCSKAAQYGAKVVVEDNQGGMYLEALIKAEDPTVRYFPVTATVSKYLRAFPIAQLYEQQAQIDGTLKIIHAKGLEALESQMTGWTPESDDSPDHVDALVWALQPLLQKKPQAPVGSGSMW